MARKHSDVVVGIKSSHWWAPDFTSVNRAIEAGRIGELPIMVDFGYFLPERPYETMVALLLRPGDISTLRGCVAWRRPRLPNSLSALFRLDS